MRLTNFRIPAVGFSLALLTGTVASPALLPAKAVPSQTATQSSVEGKSSATSRTVTVNAPDVKVTQHIRSLNFPNCEDNLGLFYLDASKATSVCLALQSTSNNEPPTSFSNNQSWQNFKNTMEYRGYIYIPSIKISCSNGRITNYTTPRDEYSYGYTKRPGGYDLGDYYKPRSHEYSIGTSRQNNYLVIRDWVASRVANSPPLFERFSSYILTSFDAPFIYTDVEEDVYCNGNIAVKVGRPIFPTTRLYINSKFQSEGVQQDDGISDLLKSGGDYHTDNNEGNLAPGGVSLSWSGHG